MSLSANHLAHSQTHPVDIPQGCQDSLAEYGICVTSRLPPDDRITPEVKAYVLIYKSDFTTLEKVAEQFFAWEDWGAYLQEADFDNTEVVKSMTMAPLWGKNPQGESVQLRRNYFIFDTKIPVIGTQRSRGVAYYWQLNQRPEETSWGFRLAEEKVEIPQGEPPLERPEGLAHQSGVIRFIDCLNSDQCNQDEFLVIYSMRIRHQVPLLPKYAAQYAREQIEALFTGMYLR